MSKAIAANEGPNNFFALEPNRGSIDRVFAGLKACLKVSEDEEDILMKTNQILYDIMPDILKGPSELLTEVASLVPSLIENLGNPQGTVRKMTHKVIGTYVKLSKRLEPVLNSLIKHGIGNLDS